MVNIFEPIKADLDLVHKKIRQHLVIKVGHISEFAHIKLPPVDHSLRPAFLVLSAKTTEGCHEKALALASIIQLIHMASYVHFGVDEDDDICGKESSDPRDGSQFPVLVGDFLYGKFFRLLSEAKSLAFLKPLAEIICHINEGSIIRKQLPPIDRISYNDLTKIIRKETAELIARACKIGAMLGPESSSELIDRLYLVGLNFGMGYGFLQRGLNIEQTMTFFNRAADELSGLPDNSARSALEHIVQSFIRQEVSPNLLVGNFS